MASGGCRGRLQPRSEQVHRARVQGDSRSALSRPALYYPIQHEHPHAREHTAAKSDCPALT
eukprot:1743816-Rhodomonas_salina.2